MNLWVKRTNTSTYFPPGFEALERTRLQAVQGVSYLGVQEPVPASGDVCLLTNTHTELGRWEALRSRVKLILHPNSGHDNLTPGWPEVPLALGNVIRAQAVAEWALAALHQHAAWLRHHEHWPASRDWPRTLLSERRTLIVGHGHVGKLLARALPHARVLDPSQGFVADLHDGWQTVILAASLTSTSRGMLDTAFFSHAPPDFLLVNPARGELLDETALRLFLAAHPRARAYLDVHAREPYPAHYWSTPQVIATPHVAGVWQGLIEAMLDYEERTLQLFTTGRLP